MLSSTDLPEERRRGYNLWPDFVVTATFYLLFLVQLIHHQLWRDELNAFGLALGSPTVGSLFHHIRYEGHPWLWYLLLWMVGRVTTSVLSLKILEACIVAGIYGLLGLRSPFSRLEKALFFLTYFISFEYAVLTRMYSLLLLFTFVYLWRRREHPEQVTANCFLLGLLASTDMMGLILAYGLLAEYGVARSLFRIEGLEASWRKFAPGLLVLMGMTVLSVWSARPASDIGWRTTGRPFDHLFDGTYLIASVASFVTMPFLPVAFGRSAASFWNPSIAQHPGFYLACLPCILSAYYAIFRRQSGLLLLVGGVVGLATAFGHLFFLGTMRHWGVTFLAFLAGLWLHKRNGKALPRVALLLLGISALSGVYTAYAQWQRPFSNAEPAAAWLRAHALEKMPIAGTPDTTIASLAVLLHRPVYMLDCSCSGGYAVFSNRRDGFSRAQIPDRLQAARRNLGDSLIYVDAYPLTAELREALLLRGMRLEELSTLTGSTFTEEDFYLYQVHAISDK